MAPDDDGDASGAPTTTATSAELTAAGEAYLRRDWVSARAGYLAAQSQAPLGADDLYALSNCAWWLGDLDTALQAQQEAYQLYLDNGQPGMAAMVALDVGYTLTLRGDTAPGSGWMSRARRLLQDLPEAPEHGYLTYIDFEVAFGNHELARALEIADTIHDMGQRHRDPTLVALGVLGQGRVQLRQGRVDTGMALLDEAMVAAVSDELDPAWAGNIYCHLMAACYEVADLRRAGEWTEATARWCETMPGAGPFMGICRVHRAQVLQVRGDWDRAEQEVRRVCDELGHFDIGAVAEAHYLMGDLRRMRGDLAGAEEAFQAAHALGRDPQPGLALLRLAQGNVEVAAASIRTAFAAAGGDALARGRLLPAAVEIAVASGDTDDARAVSDELSQLAATYGSAGFTAEALHARGIVLLAEGYAEPALPALREALRRWQRLGADNEVARVRTSLARAYEAAGDHDTAHREQTAAQLSGAPVPPASGPGHRPSRPGGLTEREAEVLSLVAAGRTNQQIAADLVLSIRTVERHLATVYQKLGVSGRSARAAAVSFALRAGMLPPG